MLELHAYWTVQLQNDGTFEGESANNPATPSIIGDYPEIYVPARSFPDGRVDDFQRHKVRAWATYSLDMKQYGRLDVSPLLSVLLAAHLQPRGRGRAAPRSRSRAAPATRGSRRADHHFGARGSKSLRASTCSTWR
jgi:hypothetical protein